MQILLNLETDNRKLVDGSNYKILDPDSPTYRSRLQHIANSNLVYLDCETFCPVESKKGALDAINGRIRLIQLGVDDEVYLMDLGGRFSNRLEITKKQYPGLKVLANLLWSDKVAIVGHNLTFDLRFLRYQFGLRARFIADTFVAARVLYGDYGKQQTIPGGFGLGNLLSKLCGRSIDKTEQKSDWGGLLTKKQLDYAAGDIIYLKELFEKLRDFYKGNHPLYTPTIAKTSRLENDLIPVAIEAEYNGIPCDVDQLNKTINQVTELYQQLLNDWDSLGTGLKPTQTTKVKDYLNERFNLGLTSLDKEVLAQTSDNSVCSLLQKIRGVQTLINNLKGFELSTQLLNDNKVHTTYKTLTGTGRLSSGDAKTNKAYPNVQAVSAKENPLLNQFHLLKPRECIKPPEGYVMAVIDLSAAHARIAADLAKDKLAIAAQNDDSLDCHSMVAEFVARGQKLDWTTEYISKARKDKNNPDSKQCKTFRDTAKNTFYGWLNGAGAKRIQAQITANTGHQPDLVDCESAIKGCEQLYPDLNEFKQRIVKKAESKAVELYGRKFARLFTADGSHLLFQMKEGKYGLQAPYTVVLAATWSRVEATAMKRSAIEVQQLADDHPEWDLKIFNVVHDELDLICRESFAELAITQCNEIINGNFQKMLKNGCSAGGETDWKKVLVKSWAEK